MEARYEALYVDWKGETYNSRALSICSANLNILVPPLLGVSSPKTQPI